MTISTICNTVFRHFLLQCNEITVFDRPFSGDRTMASIRGKSVEPEVRRHQRTVSLGAAYSHGQHAGWPLQGCRGDY